MNLSKMYLSIVWIFLFLPQIAWSGAAYDSVEELDQAIHKAEQAAVLSHSCMPDITKCDDLREQYVKTMFLLYFDIEPSDVMTEIQRQKIINMPSLAVDGAGNIIGSHTGAILVSHHKVGGFYGTPPPLTMDLEGTYVIFYWEFLGSAFQYKLQIGSQVGGNDLYDSGVRDGYYAGVENLPDDGRKLYIRVSTKVNNNWITNDFIHNAYGSNSNTQVENAAEFFQKSLIYEKQGLYTKALETIEKAIIIEPNNDTYLAYASHYARYAGQDEKGLKYGINAININKNIGWYYVTTALSAYNLGKMDIAKKYADSALKFGKNALGQANYDAVLRVMNANSVTTTPTTQVTEITTFEKKSNAIFDLVERDYAQFFFPATATQVSGSGNEIEYSRIYNNEYQAGLKTKENNLWYRFNGEWHHFGTLEEANQQLCKNKCWTVENQPTNQLQKSIHVLEIVNPQTNLGAITHDLDGSFTAYYGLKDKNGNLLSIDKVTFFDQNTQQWMSVHLDLFYFPNKITFSSGEKINIKKLSDQQINVKLINPQGTEIASKDIYLQNKTDRSNTESSQTISDIQETLAKTPNVVSLCRKREKTIKIRYIPDSFITGLSKLLDVFDLVNTIKSVVTKPTLKSVAKIALDLSRSAIANNVPNNGKTIVQTTNSLVSVIEACVIDKEDPVNCAIQVVKNIGIPLLRKANEGEIEVGEINQCSDAEKMDGYLYADCAGRIINAEGDKECRIDYGGQIEIGIFYYNPYPYKGFIEFAELGGKGIIPREFKLEIPADKTSGYFKFSAKHQVLYDPEKWACHTTETLPGEGATGEDPGSLYGLSMEIPEVPGGDFMPNGKIILSQNFPNELSIITEGNGKGYIGGTAIPCWYYFE